MATQEFSVEFGGPAVADGRMPVRDLAPALMALGGLLEVAREIAEPDAPALTLEVRTFEPGSFDASLGVAFDSAVGLLVSDPASAVATVLTLVTHGQATIPNVSAERYSILPVPLPSLDVQDRLLKKCHQEEMRMRKVSDKNGEIVRHLKEHRAALITAAVTGQIDVSGAA